MRAIAISPQRHIAIGAKNPESFREVIPDYPSQDGLTVVFSLAHFASVGVASAVDMVDMQEFQGGFAAAGTLSAVVGDDFVSSRSSTGVGLSPSFFHPVRILTFLRIVRPRFGFRRFKVCISSILRDSSGTLLASLIVASPSRPISYEVRDWLLDVTVGAYKSVHAHIIAFYNDMCVFFGQYYRDDSGLDLLREANILVNHCPI